MTLTVHAGDEVLSDVTGHKAIESKVLIVFGFDDVVQCQKLSVFEYPMRGNEVVQGEIRTIYSTLKFCDTVKWK